MPNLPCGGSGKTGDASQYLKDAWDKGVASGPGRYASIEHIIGEACGASPRTAEAEEDLINIWPYIAQVNLCLVNRSAPDLLALPR